MIKDVPRFKYRGLLVDTARHFIPMKNLKDIVVLLRMHKMNALHLHLIDDDSFPL